MSRQVMSPTRRWSVLPFVEMLDLAQEPTCGQLDDWTTTVLSKDWRPDDGMLHVGRWRNSVSTEKGQSELMGSIHCTRIPFILAVTSQSLLSPLSILY